MRNSAPAATQKTELDATAGRRMLGLRSYVQKSLSRGARKEFFSTTLVAFANRSEICALCRKTKYDRQRSWTAILALRTEPSESESGGENIKTRNSLYLGVAAVAIALAFGVAPTTVVAQHATTVSVGATDIGGVVRRPNGPEAGEGGPAAATDPPRQR